jgi:prephenate dehydrogenase
MGGSLGRALKTLPNPPSVRALSEAEDDLAAGLEVGALDRAVRQPEELLAGLDLLVYATPLEATLRLMEVHAPFLSPETAVTDMVSLKGPLLNRMRALGKGDQYVGSHPMAGGEGRGFAASRTDLFQGARIWIVPGDGRAEVLEGVEALWRSLGALPATIEARDHDGLMAWASHLPQLTSNALALALEDGGIRRGDLGPGGRDMTRLAGSAPEMWEDLFRNPPPEVLEALEAMQSRLRELKELLDEARTEELSARMRMTGRWTREEE